MEIFVVSYISSKDNNLLLTEVEAKNETHAANLVKEYLPIASINWACAKILASNEEEYKNMLEVIEDAQNFWNKH